MREMRAAQALDPLMLVLSWDIANELLAARQFTDALQHLARVDDLFPGIPVTSYFRVEIYLQQGDIKAARGVLNAVTAQPQVAGQPMFVALFGAVAAPEGHRDEARHDLQRLEEMRRTRYVDGVLVLELCAALKDHDELTRWYTRARDEHSSLVVYVPMRKDSAPGIDDLLVADGVRSTP
jgi:predicted Zn-dependent protease